MDHSSDGCNEPHLLRPCETLVLQAAWNLRTTSTDTLARDLFLSPRTVRTYFERAMLALEVHDRAGALIVAAEKGLIQVVFSNRHGGGEEDRQPVKMSANAD